MSIWQAIKLVLTLPCRDSTHLISDTLDRRLTRVERVALSLHLMICSNCRRSRKRLLLLAEALRRLAEGSAPAAPTQSATLSPDARRRIENALRQQ